MGLGGIPVKGELMRLESHTFMTVAPPTAPTNQLYTFTVYIQHAINSYLELIYYTTQQNNFTLHLLRTLTVKLVIKCESLLALATLRWISILNMVISLFTCLPSHPVAIDKGREY